MPNGKIKAEYEIQAHADFIQNIKLYNSTCVTQVKIVIGDLIVWQKDFTNNPSAEIEVGFADQVYIPTYLIAFQKCKVEVETNCDYRFELYGQQVRLEWDDILVPFNEILYTVVHENICIYVPLYNFVIDDRMVYGIQRHQSI
jgi:hypothetical protein